MDNLSEQERKLREQLDKLCIRPKRHEPLWPYVLTLALALISFAIVLYLGGKL